MSEVVTLILSNVCGAAMVFSLRRRSTDRRRRPHEPAAPSTLGRSGASYERLEDGSPHQRRLVAADLDGRGAHELRDPQQTSHSAPRGFGQPVACSADGRVLTDDLLAWQGPERRTDVGRSDARTPQQPTSEASSTPRHSASAHSARRLDRSRAKLQCSAERPSFVGATTPPRPRRLPPPSPPPSPSSFASFTPPRPRRLPPPSSPPSASSYASLRDHLPLFLLLGFLGIIAVGLFLALALTAPPSSSFSPPPTPVWYSPSPPPPSPTPPPPPSPTVQAATAAPGGGVALPPPQLTRDDGSAGDEPDVARRPADPSPDASPWWWQGQGDGARSRPSRPSHASPSHVGYVVVGGFTGAALALSSIRLRPRTRPAAASAAADALAAAGVVQGAAEALGLLRGGRAWRRALLGTAAAVVLVAPFVQHGALPTVTLPTVTLPTVFAPPSDAADVDVAAAPTLRVRLPWTFAVRRPRPAPVLAQLRRTPAQYVAPVPHPRFTHRASCAPAALSPPSFAVPAQPEAPAEAPPASASPVGLIALVVGLAIAAAAVAWLCRERGGAAAVADWWASVTGSGGGDEEGGGAGMASRVAARAKAAVAWVPGMGGRGSSGGGGSSSGSAHEASRGGTVTVRVVRATGLLSGDKGGSSDPYVVVQSAGGKKAKTSVKKKTLDPEWDETLELSVLDAAAPLSFVVWDHDKVGRNDNLGSAEISLAQIAPGVPTPLRLELSAQGTIEVVVTLVTDDARGVSAVAMGAAMAAMGAAAMGAAAMGRAAATAPHEASRGGTVTVRVVRATGLLAGDKGGTSDPFVVVQSAGDKKAKTSVKKKTLDPEWEETLELSVLDAAAALTFVVWDHDKVCRTKHYPDPEP